MIMGKNKALNEFELKEAASLKRLFVEWQAQRRAAGLPASQLEVAHMFGISQGGLSQFIGGVIPLNVEIVIVFANVLGVNIDDFSPTWAKIIRDGSKVIAGAPASNSSTKPKWISEEAYKLLDFYYSGDSDAQLEIMSTAAELSSQRPRLPAVASNDDQS